MTEKQLFYNIGSVLIRLRNAKKVTQIAICNGCGINHAGYVRLEAGRQELKMPHLFALADYYGMKPHEIVMMIENPDKMYALEDVAESPYQQRKVTEFNKIINHE